MKILVIEDEELLNSTYCAVLEASGYETTGVLSATEGLKILEAEAPDLILLDLTMPEMDGIEFLKQSEIKTKYPHTIVIVLTASANPENMVSAYTHGARSYIFKATLKPEDLTVRIEEELEKHRARGTI
jgi:CheY-like chemotaxis protein